MAFDAYIEDKKTNKRFYFRGVSPLSDNVTQPVVNIPFVSTGPGGNFLFRFSGQTEIIRFNFVIWNNGEDVAQGTHTSTVLQVTDQIQYLRDTIFNNDFDASWDFVQSRFHTNGVTVVITNLDIENPPGGAEFVIGSIEMMVGNIGSLSG